jgi:AraC-like DNA-binding protein
VTPGGERHDRDAAIVDRETGSGAESTRLGPEQRSALDAALARLHLDGAIFFRAEMTEQWAYESPPAREMAEFLRPGTERIIMFHIVESGRLWVDVDGRDRHWADAGDVVVLPYGDQHRVGGSHPAELVAIETLIDPPPWESLPVLRYGGGGERTNMVCGYLHSDDRLFNPSLHAFPPVFVAHPVGAAAHWVGASVDYALASSNGGQRADPMSMRLPELLLVEVLRLHLASAPAVDHGWIGALGDPVLAPALAQLHADPQRKWTVTDLAASAAVSRSVLDERFRHVLGRSPIRYLTDWRMHIAEDLLAGTDHGVAAIAHHVGYDSEEAFSRAFKRSHRVAPSQWRAAKPRR